MRCLLDATEIDKTADKTTWQLLFAENYPLVENSKVQYYPLRMINAEKGTIGYDKEGTLQELKTTTEKVYLTKSEKETFMKESKWKKIIFENGEAFVFPPDPHNLIEN